MKQKFSIFFLCFGLAFAGGAAQAEQPSFHRTVSVSGIGKAEAVPDRAVLNFTIETRAKQLADAKQENDKRMDAALKAIAGFSIPKEKLKTTGLSVAPQYRWEQQTNKQVFEGYTVSRSLRLNVDKLEDSEKLIAGLTKAGVDQLHGIEFTLSNQDALEAQARKAAMQDAHAKAADIAEAGGVKLGKLLSVSIGDTNMPPIARPMMMMAAKAEAAAAPMPPPLPGMVTVEQSVSAVYEIE